MSSPHNQPTPVTRYNARLGVVLFLIYSVIYAGFVMLSAFHGDLMKKAVFAGVNLAIIYGFGLIVLAFVMAMLYLVLCKPTDEGGSL